MMPAAFACAVAGCARTKHQAKGLCTHHYLESWRTKPIADHTEAGRNSRSRRRTPEEVETAKQARSETKFWSPVNKTTTCWLWTGKLTDRGYGRTSFRRRLQFIHRIAYVLLVGPIPEGHELDHLCRVRNCVNPAHLEPVVHRINSLRSHSMVADNAQKTSCLRGHEFSVENTYINSKGGRVCRACRVARRAAR